MPSRFLPHYQGRLGVGLQAYEAINHVHAHLLERSGPAYIGRLVAPRFELDEGGHLFASLGRSYQGCHHGAVARCPVQGLFYGQDFGISSPPASMNASVDMAKLS